MKILAKFYGKVTEFNNPPEKSYVILTNLETKTSVKSDAISEELVKSGVTYNDCEFEITIHESIDGKVKATITKINPNQLELNF